MKEKRIPNLSENFATSEPSKSNLVKYTTNAGTDEANWSEIPDTKELVRSHWVFIPFSASNDYTYRVHSTPDNSQSLAGPEMGFRSLLDTDGDGLTDYYEFTHRYTVKEYPCHFDPAWEGWTPAGGLPAWSLSVSADPSHLFFWKASGSTASSFEMMTSPHFNLEMSRLSPLYLEFDYRYSVADTSISYTSLKESVDVVGDHYIPFEPKNDGQWHSSGPICLFPNVVWFYRISDWENITSEFMYIHFYADTANDYFDLDNIRLSRPTNAWIPDTDWDDLTDGQEVLHYGTSPVLQDTDGDTLSDGVEVNGQVIRYADDNGDGRGYIFHLTPLPTTVVEREFDYHTNPLKQDTDMDGQPDNKDLIPLDYDMDGDGMINSLELVDPNSGNYDARVAECIASDPNLQRNQDGSYIADDDTDGDGILNINDADMDNDGMPDQYEIDHGVANGGWQNPYVFNARYGLIMAGGGSSPQTATTDANFPANWVDSYEMYSKLVNDYDYIDDNIYLLYSPWLVEHDTIYYSGDWYPNSFNMYISIDNGPEREALGNHHTYWGSTIQIRISDGVTSQIFVHTAENSYQNKITACLYVLPQEDQSWIKVKVCFSDYQWEDWSQDNPDIDDEMTYESIQNTLSLIGSKITINDFLFTSIKSHGYGGTGGFYVNNNHQDIINCFGLDYYQKGRDVKYSELNEFLTNSLQGKYARMTIIVSTCHSGTAINSLSGEKRVIITSAGDELSWTELNDLTHGAFLHEGHRRYFIPIGALVYVPVDEYKAGFIPSVGSIENPRSLKYAYDMGYAAARFNYEISPLGQVTNCTSTAQIADSGIADKTYI